MEKLPSSKPHPNQKMALAIKLSDFLASAAAAQSKNIDDFANTTTLFIDKEKDNSWFFNNQAFLLNRVWCEDDPRFIQILPYITLITKDDKFPCGTGIFTYQRGTKGTESKLHGDYSIGLGGHIEEPAVSPIQVFNEIVDCIGRELWEEVELDSNVDDTIKNMDHFSLLYDTTRPVDSVHLCMHFVVVVNEKDLGTNEDGNIDKGQFVDLNETIEKSASGSLKFEQWSKVLLEKTTWV